MVTVEDDLRATVVRAAALLREVPVDVARARPAHDKWSPLEIVGHLIDSASNNHQRFVRAQLRDELNFDGYEQVEWVRVQHYQSASWPGIVNLWEAFNLHLAHVIEHTPGSIRTRPRTDHNLHVLAWETVPRHEEVSLDYFMRDYVAHLKHHLRQIDDALAAEPRRQRDDSEVRSE